MMKKLLPWLVLLTGIGAVYLYLNPQALQQLPFMESGQESTVIYRWRDPDGNWQHSNIPPGEGIEYEVIEYRHDVNVLPLPEELKQKKD